MMISRFLLNRKTSIADIFSKNGLFQFWEVRFLHAWLPLLLGLGFGVFLALLVDREDWHFLVAAVLIVPAAMLLIRYPFAAILIWILVFPFFVTGFDPGHPGLRYSYSSARCAKKGPAVKTGTSRAGYGDFFSIGTAQHIPVQSRHWA
jgi:hypothetical protein